MINDALFAFVPYNAPLSLVGGAGVDFATDPYDILGAGAGTLVTNIWGNSTLPGQADGLSVGMPQPYISVLIGTALVANTGTPLLNVQFQGAPDDGSGGAGTYLTYAQTGDITVAQGVAGAEICRLPFVPPFPLNHRPRFLRLNFAILAATDYSDGTIASAYVVGTRDDQYQFQAAKNYTSPRYTG
jgi:hypothetical protein